jgi:hypothetical protein
MHIDIQQTPYHQRLTLRIQQRQQGMNTPKRIPNAVERIVIRLAGLPIRILASVVLRTDHRAIHAAPKRFEENVANASVFDGDDVQFRAPCVFRGFGYGVEIILWDFALGVGAGLGFADEAHAHAGEDLVVGFGGLELYPAA